MNMQTIKTGISSIAIFLLALGMAAFAQAQQSQQQQLDQLVQQLQNDSGNQQLRRQIIQLANTMTPRPAVPEEANELIGEAQAAIKTAKSDNSKSDFGDAVCSLQKASLLAPWSGGIYYDLGVAQELVGQYDDSIANFRLYLLAEPDAKDADQVQQRIGADQYSADKAAQAAQAQEQAREQQLAAQEKDQQIRAAMEQFKEMTQGTYSSKDCNEDPQAMNGMGNGCNEQEHNGRNWEQGSSSVNFWRFDFDHRMAVMVSPLQTGTELYTGPAQTPMPNGMAYGDFRIIFRGPSFQDITYECLANEPGNQQEYAPCWGQANADFSSIQISPPGGRLFCPACNGGRPLNDADYDPSVRYYYEQYYR